MSEPRFEVHKFVIPFDKFGETYELYPIGDIHRFHPSCAEGKWLRFLNDIKHNKRAYMIGIGDYDDIGSDSERQALREANIHDATRESLDDMCLRRTNKLISELSFMKGRILGLLEGNHYGQFQSGMTTTQWMCQELGCKYLNLMAFVRVCFRHTNSNKTCVFDIVAHHGWGSGRTKSAMVKKATDLLNMADADVSIVGHFHKKNIGDDIKLRLSEGKKSMGVVQRKVIHINAGTFLKSYEPGEKSYPVRWALPPASLGVVKLTMTPVREKVGKRDFTWIDLHASI